MEKSRTYCVVCKTENFIAKPSLDLLEYFPNAENEYGALFYFSKR